jgi:lysophospholipase L1-like esterase
MKHVSKCVMNCALLLALAAACARTSSTPAAAPVASATARAAKSTPAPIALARFEPEIRAFESADRASMPAPGGIVFFGSSSIRRWTSLAADFPGLPVLNRGFGGSTFPEANHYVARAVLRYRPRTVVVYEGDNDLVFGRTSQQVLADYREFVRLVRDSLPSARIVVIGIKPSPSRWELAGAQREANRLLRDAVAGDTLQSYVDVFAPMLGASGRPRPELFVRDSLHMTPAGYAIWRAQVAPQLR